MAADATPIHIDADLASIIDGAFDGGKPIVVAYVDGEGQPHISFRGSAQHHSDDQLAIWIREPRGGLVTALAKNNRVTLMYRDSAQRINYLFYGRARTENDPSVAKAIYEKSPKAERDRDPKVAGVGIVIDIDAIQGGSPDHRVDMRRT